PDNEPFGRNTTQAMLQGVYHGIRGMVQRLVERYAEHYEAYPLVIATGGDAATLFEGDPFIDRIVPELTLLGIAVAAKHALSGADSATDDANPSLSHRPGHARGDDCDCGHDHGQHEGR